MVRMKQNSHSYIVVLRNFAQRIAMELPGKENCGMAYLPAQHASEAYQDKKKTLTTDDTQRTTKQTRD